MTSGSSAWSSTAATWPHSAPGRRVRLLGRRRGQAASCSRRRCSAAIQPLYREMIAEVKRYGLIFSWHCCGSVHQVLPLMIDAGSMCRRGANLGVRHGSGDDVSAVRAGRLPERRHRRAEVAGERHAGAGAGGGAAGARSVGHAWRPSARPLARSRAGNADRECPGDLP